MIASFLAIGAFVNGAPWWIYVIEIATMSLGVAAVVLVWLDLRSSALAQPAQ